MTAVRRGVLIALLVMALVAAPLAVPRSAPPGQSTDGMRGINIATLLSQAVTIYDHPAVPGTGEPLMSYVRLQQLGHRLIRLPIDWSFLQPGLDAGNQDFHPAYWAAVREEVGKIKAAGLRVVLGLHNGCEWREPKREAAPTRVCGAGLTVEQTNQVWRKLSDGFRDDPAVVAYDLFNEPTRFSHPTRRDLQAADKPPYSVYQRHVNAVVKTLREAGDRKTLWVESLCCSPYMDFASTDPNGPWVDDRLDRIVYSQHMYPVRNSGQGEDFDAAKLDEDYVRDAGKPWVDRGYERGFLGRLREFGDWCSRSKVTCSIGEVGWYGPGQSDASAEQWNRLGDRWYAIANGYGLAVTYFGASSAFHGPLWAYDAPGPDVWFPAVGLSRKQSQATVIERPENLSRG
ncbi:glycoside hydrolase family 5 protein [Tsukamurella paurometabola]|uniref:Cellulase (Glycosyl hydrolase family 5) n=1 Tax=Tsukamurella paurometabola TaxID=2061 RepID=A0A3P8L1C8_TSUPA|nr:cellulase family glycosylhydrolase [Tsukamurella paurometabola]UEA81354.1 glycoside hydrolase family 5 protein [Tsukamurella paurometabola]VDR38335.1 Cellulase (glycosyl hydrolase family 5) [Tsukamurella paurometabola]